jgi:LPXTG-motif cell wall-anchored protein
MSSTVPAATTTTAAVGPINTGSLPTTGGGTRSVQVTIAAMVAAFAGLSLVLLTRRRRA